MYNELNGKGFVVFCSVSGVIKSVSQNEYAPALPLSAGSALDLFFDVESRVKVQLFLNEVCAKGSAFDWELVACLEESSVTTLHCAGFQMEDGLVVIGASSRDCANHVMEEMLRLNNEQSNRMRILMKDAQEASRNVERDNSIYNEMTQLSNQLSTMQREQLKKNRELELLNHKLQESHNLLRALSKQVPGMIYQYRLYPDGHSCFPYTSDAISELFEVTPDDVLHDATPFLSSLHPDDAEGVMLSIAGSARTLEPWEYEYRVKLPHQGTRWRYSFARPERMTDGSVLWHGFVNDVTDQKNLEYQLSDSIEKASRAEARLEIILKSTDQGIYGIDEAGCFTYVNKAGMNMLGYRNEDIVGKNSHSLIHHSRLDGTPYLGEDCPLDRANRTGSRCSIDSEVFWRSDGSFFFVEYSTFPIIEQGKIIGSVVTFSDISRRRQAEEELNIAHRDTQASHDTLEAIVESMSDWLWKVDAQGRYTYCSPQIEKHLGYTPSEVIGTSPFDYLVADQADMVIKQFTEIMGKKSRIINLESWNTSKGGQSVLLSTNGVPIFDEGGNLTGYRGVSTNITKLKEYEYELLKLSRAVEQSPVSIFITNLQGEIEFINPRFTEQTGYSADEVIGKTPNFLQSEDTDPETYRNLWAMVTSGKTWHGELVSRRKDGSLFWELSSTSPLRNDKGEVIHYLTSCEDITDKKQLIDELNDAKERAESATRAKSTFLSSMSHEIRTPMNGVIGMTSLLSETELTPEQQDFTEAIRKSGENLLELINDILDFSKIEAGKLDLEILDFDLCTMMEDTAELLSMRSAEKGLELVCSIDPAIPAGLRGDAGRVRQIITNLAGNAIKFTPSGEIVLKATCTDEQPDSVMVLFEVSDSGIGIPADRLEAVFAPFTQAEGSTTRKFGGTGLGLAICKQLAEIMGGTIGVTSEYGVGSTFHFTVRFAKGTRTTCPLESRTELTGCRILVVDDNNTCRSQLVARLEKWGCHTAAAADGEQGLALVREGVTSGLPFQVALVDQKMPGPDGFEVGRRLKNDPALASTRMVLITDFGQSRNKILLDEIACAGYLTKPVRRSKLYDVLAIALGKGALGAETVPLTSSRTISGNPSIRILLAEDNVINQKVAQKTLHNLGYTVDVVADGREAVRALETERYDLVLMDCQMPEMDGFEATAAIRDPDSKVLNRRIPIIAMTANAMAEDRDNCLNAGMDDYMSKPVKKDVIAGILSKWLEFSP